MESKTAEEYFRAKMHEEYQLPQKFMLRGMDFLNAEKSVQWAEEYASIKLAEKDKEVEGLRYNLKKYAETVDHRNASILEYQEEIERLKSVLNKLPDLLHDSLGNRECEYTIKDMPENSCVDSGEFWITHNDVGSGEPLKQWIKSEIDKSLNK